MTRFPRVDKRQQGPQKENSTERAKGQPRGTMTDSPNLMTEIDERFMRRALELAAEAGVRGEIPIGAVIVQDGEIIAEASNLKETNGDPLGHAEVLAIRAAAAKLGRWRLSGCTLYVTLEPCTMCAGAIVHARVDRVVYAATDPKAGAVRTLYEILKDPRLNHSPVVDAGVLESEASGQLKDFFRRLRGR